MSLQNYEMNDVLLVVVGIAGALGSCIIGVCLSIQKRKCEEIGFCGCKIKRNVQAIIDEERLQMTGHTGSTPRPSLDRAPEMVLIEDPENPPQNPP